jgi:predicted anti-sigma-YlaC factor YlaD
MNCQQIRIQIIEELDHERTGTRSVEVQTHLRDCSDCHAFLEEQEQLSSLLADNRWETLAAAFSDWFRMPQLRHALAGSAFVLFASLALLNLGGDEMEAGLMAQLDSFEMEVTENPFLANSTDSNPFFELDSGEGNPFEVTGSQK